MAERLPFKWCASNYSNQITRKKMTDEAVRFPRGTYHDTWEEAKAALVERREREFRKAQSLYEQARKALSKAQQMKPPTPKEPT